MCVFSLMVESVRFGSRSGINGNDVETGRMCYVIAHFLNSNYCDLCTDSNYFLMDRKKLLHTYLKRVEIQKKARNTFLYFCETKIVLKKILPLISLGVANPRLMFFKYHPYRDGYHSKGLLKS